MIRSCSIPPVLNRICDDESIKYALLVTSDGELLGASSPNNDCEDPESFGTLVADIAVDYLRLGEEFAAVDAVDRARSSMQCLIMELDQGTVAVSSCLGGECFVIAVAAKDAPLGLLKSRLQSLSLFIQESMSSLTERP